MGAGADRIRARLDHIAVAVRRLEELSGQTRETFLQDVDSQDIARSRLLTAIEAALNICYHVAASRLNRVPEEYAQCFEILGDADLISKELAGRLGDMARFRNMLVHVYIDIDYGRVHDFLPGALKDLRDYSSAVSQLI